MAERVVANGDVQPCCQDKANRLVVEERPHVRVEQCAVCQRKHYRALMAATGSFRVG